MDFSTNSSEFSYISYNLNLLQKRLNINFGATRTDQNMRYLITGLYFGYPVCCIESFLDDIEKAGGLNAIITKSAIIRREVIREEQSSGGFVPCFKHAEELKQNIITIDNLISADRICPYPFPNIAPVDEKRYSNLMHYAGALEAYINKHQAPSESFNVFLKTLNKPNNSNHDNTNLECICEECKQN